MPGQPLGGDTKDEATQGGNNSRSRTADEEGAKSERAGWAELAPIRSETGDWKVALSEPDTEKMVGNLIRLEDETRRRLELQRTQLDAARHSREVIKEGNERTEAMANYYYEKAKILVGKKESNLGEIKERSRRNELKIERRIADYERSIIEQMGVQADINREINMAINKRFEEVAERGTEGAVPTSSQVEVELGSSELQDDPNKDMEVEVLLEDDGGSDSSYSLVSICGGSDGDSDTDSGSWK